jgi:hypothetical protein
MSNPHDAVRPAGSPMVPQPRPDADARSRPDSIDEASDQIRDAGRSIAHEARRRASGEMDVRTSLAGDRVMEAASEIHDVASRLREEDHETAADLADELAGRIERFGIYLRETAPERLVNDARDFARRRPAAVAAGAAVVGIAAGRLIKAMSEEGGERR